MKTGSVMLPEHKLTVWFPLLVATAVLLLLSACASRSVAPIDARSAPPSERINIHLVERGDTLFSIAWRYQKDLKKLARLNHLAHPYTIYVGQRLRLDTENAPAVVARSRSSTRAKQTSPPTTKSATSSSISSPRGTVSSPVVSPSSPAVSAGSTKPSSYTPSRDWRWTWPVKGRVSKRFNATPLFKGIDIISLPGAPVYPAGPGVVVYSGQGLRGYGNLVIVKHNDVFLSAYAHNRKIFVKEGQQVTQQTRIAEVGGDPANVRRFYFEVRKDGKPVNPLGYLPK
ncbi:MAG: peptidoglycan DD-metalloendopeptidase family protein [bacterium]